MKILIIGAGWIGFPLAQKLKNLGHDIICTFQTKAKEQKLLQAGLKVLDSSLEQKFDLMVSTIPATQANIIPNFKYGHRIICLSSTSIYKDVPSKVSENSPLKENDQSIYEECVKQNFNQYCILRLAGLIGYDRHPGNFLSGKSNIKGSLHPVNLIHRDDVIQALVKIIERNNFKQEIYNLAASVHPKKQAFYQYASQLLGKAKPEFDLSDESQNKTVSSDKFLRDYEHVFIFDDPFNYLKVLELKAK